MHKLVVIVFGKQGWWRNCIV